MALFKRRAETGKYQKWFNLSKDDRDRDKKAFQAALNAYKKVKGVGNWQSLNLEDRQRIVAEILDCLTSIEERLSSGDTLAYEINKEVAAAGCTVDQAFKAAALLVRRQDVQNYGSDRRRSIRTITYKQPVANTGGGGGGGGRRRDGGRATAIAIASAKANATATGGSGGAGGAGGAGGNAYVNVTDDKGPGTIFGFVWDSRTIDVNATDRIAIPDITVLIRGRDRPYHFYKTTTRDNGYWQIKDVEPGHYSLEAQDNNRNEHFRWARNGYVTSTKIVSVNGKEIEQPIRVRSGKNGEYNIIMEPIRVDRPVRRQPKPGYHIISPKESRKIGPFRFPFYKRPHDKDLPSCPACGKRTLVEEVDDYTGRIFYRCANKDCAAFLNNRRLTPDEIGIEGKKVPFFGLNARERANKRLSWEKSMSKLREQYKNDEITERQFEGGKERIKSEIHGVCPDCGQATLVAGAVNAHGEVQYYRCTNPDCNASRTNAQIRPQDVQKYKKGFVTRVGGPLAQISRKAGPEVVKGVAVAAIIGIGAVIASIFGNYYFFIAFLSVGLYVLTPSPESGQFQEGPMGWGHILPWAQGGTHAGFAWMKSITKVTAIIFFAIGFSSMGDIFNTFFVATCLVGYFMLKREYDPKRPGDFIESLLRFGILGCYFIPFYVFASIFNSYVLAAIALAFFAIPPMPKKSGDQALTEVLAAGLSGQTAYYEMFDKILFLGLMGFALLGSGSLGMDLGIINIPSLGWQLTGTLKATFIYFWIISAIGGFFSPANERPLTGILFLGGATIIYAVGPGSQDVGSALLGQWWPSVNQAVTSISEPIGKMFGQLGKTFGDAFLLLTNPVGYATQLMNGSYANNPVGETGAFGLELSGFDVSPIFLAQPFMITANIKNNGAFDAEYVSISFTSGAKAPTSRSNLPGVGSVSTPAWDKTLTQPITISEILGSSQGCDSSNLLYPNMKIETNYLCIHNYKDDSGPLKFTRQNIWQTVFSSSGIKCEVSSTYELRKKSMPINVTLQYKYQSDSKVTLEFISQSEWERLAKLEQLETKLQFIKSVYSSAPVKFPIGTPGLKNPILETQDFHIALNIMSDQAGGKITGIEEIVLNYPLDFELYDSNACSPEGKSKTTATGKTITWTNKKEGDQIFFCHFNALKKSGQASKLGTSPTKTYIITAHANYSYRVSKEKLVKMEFGSWCCADKMAKMKDECASPMVCCPEVESKKGICIPPNQVCETTRERDCPEFNGKPDDCRSFSPQKSALTSGMYMCECQPSSTCDTCKTVPS